MMQNSNASMSRWWGIGIKENNMKTMKTMILFGVAALTLVILTGSILQASAGTFDAQPGSADPQPGYVYYVVYNQTDGYIRAAGGCPSSSSPNTCIPILRLGESVIWITDNQTVVKAFFADLQNSKMEDWHVNLQTHQLERVATTSSGPIAPPTLGIASIQVLFPALTLIGAALSTVYVRRRAHKQSS